MILLVYSVYDKGVSAYLPPFYVRAKGEALRSFQSAVEDASGAFSKYPHDYVLVELGQYDDASGCFSCHDPVRVVSAVECLSDTPSRAVPADLKQGFAPWLGEQPVPGVPGNLRPRDEELLAKQSSSRPR